MSSPDESAITAELRQHLYETLSEVIRVWRLPADRWDPIAKIVDTMADAVRRGDGAALDRAGFELDLAGPRRLKVIADGTRMSATRRVRDCVAQLVHVLGFSAIDDDDDRPAESEPETRPSPRPSGGLAATGRAAGLITAPELVVHLFCALDGPIAEDGYEQLRQLWSACARTFGPVTPMAGGAVLPLLPDSVTTVPSTPVLAAQRGAVSGFQAILRRENELLNLSVGLSPPADGRARSWSELLLQWERVARRPLDKLVGEARIYQAKVRGLTSAAVEPSAELAEEVAKELISCGLSGLAGGTAVRDGFAVWEAAWNDEGRALRHFAVLAAEDRDDPLSDWTWSRGDPTLPPFARYLMHAAKVRYELRVRDHAEQISGLRQGAQQGIEAVRRWPEPNRSAAAVSTLLPLLDRLRADRSRIARMISGLNDMARTVHIARTGMHHALEEDSLAMDQNRDTFLADDAGLATWLTEQLDHDAGYLRSTMDDIASTLEEAEHAGPRRAVRSATAVSAATAAAAPTIGVVTAMPVEFAAVHRLLADATRSPVPHDRADYFVGTMPSLDSESPHRVVLTMLGKTANDAAAEACANLIRSFGSVRQILMVGVAAGVPAVHDPARHVRLGDIVVSTWGIVDYDHVVDRPEGVELREPFPRPSPLLTRKAKLLEAGELNGERPWERWIRQAAARGERRPPDGADRLYAPHDPNLLLAHPDPALTGHRKGKPKVHYGRIGSADRSLRNGVVRDALAARYQLRAVEMEGKGIGDAAFAGGREWFVIRGVCDYGDSRMDNVWRPYASSVAAAYLRAILAECTPFEDS
ncbi:MAG: CATRA conflict system CASPASE/TPR repeat-associated protein [Catenulispora sp.]